MGWAAWPDLEAAGGAAGGWGRETGSSRIRATLLKSPATVGESGLFLFRFCSESAHGGSPGALRAAPVPGTPGRGWGGVRGGKGPPSREGRGEGGRSTYFGVPVRLRERQGRWMQCCWAGVGSGPRLTPGEWARDLCVRSRWWLRCCLGDAHRGGPCGCPGGGGRLPACPPECRNLASRFFPLVQRFCHGRLCFSTSRRGGPAPGLVAWGEVRAFRGRGRCRVRPDSAGAAGCWALCQGG